LNSILLVGEVGYEIRGTFSDVIGVQYVSHEFGYIFEPVCI